MSDNPGYDLTMRGVTAIGKGRRIGMFIEGQQGAFTVSALKIDGSYVRMEDSGMTWLFPMSKVMGICIM